MFWRRVCGLQSGVAEALCRTWQYWRGCVSVERERMPVRLMRFVFIMARLLLLGWLGDSVVFVMQVSVFMFFIADA